MEAATVIGGQYLISSISALYRPPCDVFPKSKLSSVHRLHLPSSNLSLKQYPLNSVLKNGLRRGKRRNVCVRASATDPAESATPIAPLQLESPIGQFLAQILKNHPHLLPAAVEQQLERLQTDRDEDPSWISTDLVLCRRIAEVKENERGKTLEAILYALVVQKFMDANVPLITTVSNSSSNTSGKVDTWPDQVDKLKRVHSPEVYEMIKNHLAHIMGNQLTDTRVVAQLRKLKVGQVYAASMMYGYFLKRVDQRFQLEKTMKTTFPFDLDCVENSSTVDQGREAYHARPNSGYQASMGSSSSCSEGSSSGGDSGSSGFGCGVQTQSRLRSYVTSFDAETLQRYVELRSKEAVTIVEKHTEALFERLDIVITALGGVESLGEEEEVIKVSFGGLTTLVLEAVTFGSFLWDVESYVDSRYHFIS